LNPNSTNNKPIDLQGFEKLFRQYFKPLVAFAKKYVGDLDSSREIVHEVFLNLWSKKERIHAEGSVKSYLYTSTYNRCLNFIRDNKKFDRNTEITNQFQIEEQWDFSAQMEGMELEEKIDIAINSLPQKCKEIFILSRFENLKYHEIAGKLNLSVKTVESQMSRALLILRESLRDYLGLLLFFITNFPK
jgi:RNA polymerase sigma-70 factor, ECF subfamily